MNHYLAYGTCLVTSLDLGAYLCTGTDADHRIEVSDSEFTDIPDALTERITLFNTQNKEVAVLCDRNPEHLVTGQSWCFEVESVLRVFWVQGANRVQIQRLGDCTDQLLAFWLIHLQLPIYLTLERIYHFIHACSVEVDGHTVLFTAPSRGGKSTLTDHFLKHGHTLVSDDKVATYTEGGTFYAVPSHPNHRPYREVADLGIRVDKFSARARPIATIYVLAREDPAASVKIARASGHASYAQMVPNFLFNFRFLREAQMNYLADLVSLLPVYRVGVPWDLKRLDDVYDAICGQFGRVSD